jgi:hypothetical protein
LTRAKWQPLLLIITAGVRTVRGEQDVASPGINGRCG